MSKKKSKIIKLNVPKCTPEDCEHCIYIGEGDFVCDKNDDYVTIIEDFIPTDDYLRCKE